MRTDKEERKQVIIIGGGAAGMMAAIFAARNLGGHHVRIIEKNDKLGRKLLATGNGRCNISNRFCGDSSLLSPIKAFQLMNVSSTLDFFQQLGIITREESEGRLYPYSEQASSVQQALLSELKALNVDIWYNAKVCHIERSKAGFQLEIERQVEKKTNHKTNLEIQRESIFSQKVIIATGGKAGPQYGSNGEGFTMAKEFGHSIVKTIPSLTQITSEKAFFKELKGVRAKGCVTLLKNEEPLDQESGEIQFTENGLSGICIFNLSRLIRLENCEITDYTIRLDLMPELSTQELFDLLVERALYLGNRKIEEYLNGLVNGKLAPVILREAGIDLKTSKELELLKLQKNQIKQIALILKKWNISVSGTKGWKEAQVTSGGVPMNELDEETLESKLVKNLYFAGEVTDVDGKCGGYNLQWAWSSGAIAGRSASDPNRLTN